MSRHIIQSPSKKLFQGYQQRGRERPTRKPRGVRRSVQRYNKSYDHIDDQSSNRGGYYTAEYAQNLPSSSTSRQGYFTAEYAQKKYKRDISNFEIKSQNDCVKNIILNDENKNKRDFRYLLKICFQPIFLVLVSHV